MTLDAASFSVLATIAGLSSPSKPLRWQQISDAVSADGLADLSAILNRLRNKRLLSVSTAALWRVTAEGRVLLAGPAGAKPRRRFSALAAA